MADHVTLFRLLHISIMGNRISMLGESYVNPALPRPAICRTNFEMSTNFDVISTGRCKIRMHCVKERTLDAS